MGQLETKIGDWAHSICMPVEVPDWVGGKVHEFPEPPADCLLLLSHILLAVVDDEAAKQFLLEGLGAQAVQNVVDGELRVMAGATQLRLTRSSAAEHARLAQAWPGHFYVWVADLKQTLQSCIALQSKLGEHIIEKVVCNQDESIPNLIVLHDPSNFNTFVVNQAPKRKLIEKMRKVCGFDPAGPAVKAPNLVAVIEAVHFVAPGTAAAIAQFYRHFLGAAAGPRRDGYTVHFSLGPVLQQTLTFIDSDDIKPYQEDALPGLMAEICIYATTLEKYQAAFQTCYEAGIVESCHGGWEAARQSCEFRFWRCPDPDTGLSLLCLRHIVRLPKHPEWPLPAL